MDCGRCRLLPIVRSAQTVSGDCPASRTSHGLVVAGPWRVPIPRGYDLLPGSVPVGLRPEATPIEVFLSEPVGSEVIVNARIGELLVEIRTVLDARSRPVLTSYFRARPRGLRLDVADVGLALSA